MESESDEEFFDAEDFVERRASIIKQSAKETNVDAHITTNINEKLPPLIKPERQKDNIIQNDCEKILRKDKEISKLQEDFGNKLENIDSIVDVDLIKEQMIDLLSIKDIEIIDNACTENSEDSLKKVNKEEDTKDGIDPAVNTVARHKSSEILTKKMESPSQPVAPPRRKKKQKKNIKQINMTSTDMIEKPTYGILRDIKIPLLSDSHVKSINEMNPISAVTNLEGYPCIHVSTSTLEMSHVLEAGNSLEIVYNEDLVSRRSEGVTESQSNTASSALIEGNTVSAIQLTDEEILQQVGIKNLDTGETIPLSEADDKLPECTNPLDLHIFKIAKDCGELNEGFSESRDDEDGHMSDTSVMSAGKMQDRKKKLRKFFGKTVKKIRSVADEVKGQGRREDSSSEEEDQNEDDGDIKFKNHRVIRDRLMFNKIKLLQEISGEHIGAVWTMKFSVCGKLLATSGQDNIVRVWVLKEHASHFEEMRLKYSRPSGRQSPTGSMTSYTSTASTEEGVQDIRLANNEDDSDEGPFRKAPFVLYHGHTSDVLDLSWSKNFFLLSSSMDKTVRLWHISRNECLCCFQHVDFVTAICFHPKDDRYFLSGSLDGKIRLWNIPEKKVALWNEIDGSGTSLITAANFCQNGKLAAVGTYYGRCIFYDTERLKYHTQVTVRSSRGKNSRGRKISGIESMPGDDKVLITSNDSRIRLYDLKDHSLYCKYKGLQNESSQIKASFSNDGKLILCGSEDKFVHIWCTQHEIPNVRRDRNEYYESFSAHDAVVTTAIFAPYPNIIMGNNSTLTSQDNNQLNSEFQINESKKPFEVIVTADWQGGIKLFINR